MEEGELEDVVERTGALDADPLTRVIDQTDRPEDEWDNIAWQRIVRHRRSPTHMDAWGNPSER